MDNVLALDLGGTAVKAAVLDGENRLLWQAERPSHGREGGSALLAAAFAAAQACPLPYAAIGVSTTGQVDGARGVIVYANDNVPRYTGMAVGALMAERFRVPVAVENDVNAAALGEARLGAGQGERDFLCLTYGTGIGGALILNGRVYGGARGVAGEVGHLVTHPGGRPCPCGHRGCYEQYASATALVREAARVDGRIADGRAVFARLDDPAIRAVADAWLDEVLLGLTGLIHTLNPALMVLGGGVMEQPWVLARLRALLPERVMGSFLPVRLEAARLGNLAGVYGAAMLARARLNDKGR